MPKVVCSECGAPGEITSRIGQRCAIPLEGGGMCTGRFDFATVEMVATLESVADALDGIESMSRGGVFPGGRAMATIMFRSEEARALFAGVMVRRGVKVTAR